MDQLPALFDIVSKGGAAGVLFIVCFVLVIEIKRLRSQLPKLYAEREAYRLHYAVYKGACDQNNIKVDTSALQPLPGLPQT